MNPETKLQRLIMLALSEAGCTVFRNETGVFWAGKVIHKEPQAVTLGNARPIPCGLAVGSSDIIGISPNGKFLAAEVKTPKGRVRPEQTKFIEAVIRAGGIAGIVRSVEDALDLIK